MHRLLIALFASTALLAACASGERRGPPPGGFGEPPPPGFAGPGHGGLFASPMGEPFRGEHAEQAWFAGADADHDGRLTRADLRADAARFFAVLDRGKDGEIDPDDVDVYENQLFPELRTGGVGGGGGGSGGPREGGRGGARGGRGGRGGGGPPGGGGGGRPGGEERGSTRADDAGAQGAARFGYIALPEPVTAADRNFNRGVDAGEFAAAADERFALLDLNHDGAITAGELPKLALRGGGGPPRGRPPR